MMLTVVANPGTSRTRNQQGAFMRIGRRARSLAGMCVLLMVVALLAMAAAGPGFAQPQIDAAARAQRLDELFAELKTTKDEREGEAAVAEIWKLWFQSGRPELDESMEQAAKLIGHGLAALALPLLDDIVVRGRLGRRLEQARDCAMLECGDHDRRSSACRGSKWCEPPYWCKDCDARLRLGSRRAGASSSNGIDRIE